MVAFLWCDRNEAIWSLALTAFAIVGEFHERCRMDALKGDQLDFSGVDDLCFDRRSLGWQCWRNGVHFTNSLEHLLMPFQLLLVHLRVALP